MGDSGAVGRLLEPVGRSFTAKLVVASIAVALAVGLVGVAVVAQTAGSAQADAEERMENAAVGQAARLDAWIGGTKRQTTALASAEQLRRGSDEEIGSYLEHRRRGMDEAVLAVHYVDVTAGQVAASSEREAVGTDVSDEPWTRAGFGSGAPRFVEPAPPGEEGASGDRDDEAAIGAIVTDVDGGHRLAMLVDLETAAARLGSPTGSETAFTTVLSEDGAVLANTADRSGGTRDRIEPATFDGEAGYVDLEMGEAIGTTATGYARVDGADLVVAAHEPRSAVLSAQSAIARSVAAVFLAAIGGLAVVGVVVARDVKRSIGRLTAGVAALERGNLDVDLETDRTDEIGDLSEAFDRLRRALEQSIDDVNARNGALHDLASELEATARAYRDVMERAADGDLTARLEEEGESEAMAEVAAAFNRMIADLEHAVANVTHFGEHVAEESAEVTASAEEIERASGQVADAVQEISRLTEDQHRRYETVLEEAADLSAATDDIASLATGVAEVAEQTASAGDEGREAAGEAIDALSAIDEDAERAVDEISRLEGRLEEVEEITAFIRRVANETNLLALNANIEASRSRGGDSGFGVVAGEVKELSSDVESAAEEIETMVAEITAQAEDTASAVREARREIDESASTVAAALESLEEIATYADRTHDGTEEISAATTAQADAIQEVTTMVDEAATVGEDVATAANEVAAAAEEQTAGLASVVQSAETLSTHARALDRTLGTFEVDTGWSPATSPGED